MMPYNYKCNTAIIDVYSQVSPCVVSVVLQKSLPRLWTKKKETKRKRKGVEGEGEGFREEVDEQMKGEVEKEEVVPGEEEGAVVALLQEEEKVVVHLAEQTKGEAEDEEEGVTMARVGRGWCHRTSLNPIFLLTKCRGDCMMGRWLRAS